MIKAINCNAAIIKKFTSEFLKEKRKLKLISQNNRLIIRRYSDGITATRNEVKAIEYLKNKLTGIKIPEIVNCENDYIDFEYIEGIRCFNFLIQMKKLYSEQKHKAKVFKLAGKILAPLNHHLTLFQSTAGEIQKILKVRDYPYLEKTVNALELLSKIIGISKLDIEVEDDVQCLSEIINVICDVPFRDSTPKNAIIHVPGLSIRNFSSGNERNQNIMTFLCQNRIDADMIAERIYHIDYSGFPFLCSRIDDWICLNLHESTKWLSTYDVSMSDNQKNAVFLATAVFRFIRLGGRKLAYQLLHKNAANIRYQYESALYYFTHIGTWLSNLTEMGVIKGNKWLQLNASLMKACSLTPDVDFFDDFKGICTGSYYSDVYPY
jgi:hypothetical protein